MTALQNARRQYNLAEKRHAAAQICGRYDMSAKQTRRMYHAAENLRKWAGILARAEADERAAKTRSAIPTPDCSPFFGEPIYLDRR